MVPELIWVISLCMTEMQSFLVISSVMNNSVSADEGLCA